MKFEKGFNPGQNNTYTEVNMGDHSQYLPNVTQLTINNGVKQEDKGETTPQSNVSPKSPFERMGEPDPNKDLTSVKTAILNYTSRLSMYLKPEWMQSWERFWTGLLDIDVIENEICKIGKQKDTTFNRKFVCTIINYLNGKGFFKETYNATNFARFLEGDEWHSIRTTALCYNPDESVCKRIDGYIEIFNL